MPAALSCCRTEHFVTDSCLSILSEPLSQDFILSGVLPPMLLIIPLNLSLGDELIDFITYFLHLNFRTDSSALHKRPSLFSTSQPVAPFASRRRGRDFTFDRKTVVRAILVRVAVLQHVPTLVKTCSRCASKEVAARLVFLADRSPEACPKYLDV